MYCSTERKRMRMKEWDYSSDGMYFVTICVKDQWPLFGEVEAGEMKLNGFGMMTAKFWQEIPEHFENVKLDEFMVMPNHVHGVVRLNGDPHFVGKADLPSLQNESHDRSKMLLPKVVQGFKAAVPREHNRISDEYFAWQSSFHDHLIRDAEELEKIQNYIISNPSKWREDDFFVESKM